jgi:hypothetical protein
MGLFSGLFGGPPSIERRLEKRYVPMLRAMMGLSTGEAQKRFQEMLARAKQAAQSGGTTQLPERYGDLLLQQEKTDEKVNALLAKARNDGATDLDIRQWWNMHDIERRMVMEVDNLIHLAHYISLRQNGLSAEDAAVRIKQFHPYYGDPDDTSFATGEDRLLPYELKDRINRWNTNQGRTPANLELGELRTFNALVRREIRRGNI